MHGGLRLALLGKPQLTYNDLVLTAERISAKGQALLVYLAVTGQSHSRSALAGLLWGDMPEETARANLRLTLSKLRKFVPAEILQTSRLEAGLTDYWLDVTVFEKRLEIGDWRLGNDQSPISQTQAANLQSLLDLYHGDFLDDFQVPNAPDFDDWVAGQRQRQRQTAVSGLAKWLHTAVQTNDVENGITLARKLLTIEPWYEDAHRQLMYLLALSGQRSTALAQYEICRRLLYEELGIEPSAEIASLFEQIKADKVTRWHGDKVTEASHPLPPSPPHLIPSSPPDNLPTQLTSFIGRSAELSRLTERLGRPDYRLLTLLGEGGAGKTRLALAAAARVKNRFQDGVWFVSLAGLETAVASVDPLALENTIAGIIAAAIDIIFAGAEPPKSQLIQYLRRKNCLLLLDNFEPLLTAAGFILEILTAAPGVTILTTSREPLHLQAEAIVRVEGLALPPTDADSQAAAADAIRLFAERAERTTGREIVTPDTLSDVVQLCRFVYGLPLGIELIAAWTRWLALPDILRGLEEKSIRLETSMQDMAPRHRSMRAVFDYSWALLSAEEQQVLAQCAVFRRGFQLAAAREVAAASPTTLFALVDKTLVQHREDGYYGLHELLRQYAEARLDELAVDQPELYGRHATYYLQMAQQQESAMTGPQPHDALRRLQADGENLAQAWQWACRLSLPDLLAAGVGGMSHYWNYAGLFAEGEVALVTAVASVQPLLSVPETQPELYRLLARLCAERAWLLFDLNRLDEMESEAQACLHWVQFVEDAGLEANGRLRLGQVYWRRGEFEAAGEELQKAQQLAAAAGEKELEATVWRNLAAVTWKLGNLAMAEDACQQSLRLHQQTGDIRSENRTRHFLSLLALERHDFEAVQTWLAPVALLAREIGERRVELGVQSILGQTASYQGAYEQSLDHFARERELLQEMDVPWQWGGNASNTGDTRLRLGDYAGAHDSYEQALTTFRQIQSVQAESNVLAYMGLLAELKGQFADGRALCETALQLAQQADARREQAFARLFLAHNLAGLGQWADARQAYTQAQTAWNALNDPLRYLEAQAGTARAAWMLGDGAAAVTAVNDILTYLQTHSVDGADDPVRIYVTCYEILQQMGDTRAEAVLGHGRAFVQVRLNRIQNAEYRQMFMENVPSHRTLLNYP